MAEKRLTHYQVIILGSGPAGLTAALYTPRANLEPLVIEGSQPGGQLTITTVVENFPGFPSGILGPELMALFKQQAERFGTRFLYGDVNRVDLSRRPFSMICDDTSYTAEALIIATGAASKWLGLESEKRLTGYGVSSCATCDGFFFQDKEVIVIGGGGAALKKGVFFTKFARTGARGHPPEPFRPSKIMCTPAR